MKKYIIFTFLFISFFESKAQNEKEVTISIENISKKWIFSDLINEKFSKEEYKETKDLLTDTFIEFKKDMTFTFSFIVDLEGTWKLDKNIIYTKDRKGDFTWEIHKISEKEIILSKNDAEQKLIFIAE